MFFGQHQDTELWKNQQARSKSPRVFCFWILILLFFQSQISTFLAFSVRIECLCGTHPHRLYLWTPCKPRRACVVKLELLKSWNLEIDYFRAPCHGADQKTPGLWERDRHHQGSLDEIFVTNHMPFLSRLSNSFSNCFIDFYSCKVVSSSDMRKNETYSFA